MRRDLNRACLFAALWAVVIFTTTRTDRTVFSDLPNQLIRAITPPHRWVIIWSNLSVYVSKAYHVTEFALLCHLLFLAFKKILKKPEQALAASVVLSTLYGAFDEWHQTFIPGRRGRWTDFVIDCVGIAMASSFILWRNRRPGQVAAER